MRKKHYEAIAAILRSNDYSETYSEKKTYESICSEFADYFATDNANFDRDRFLQACGIPCDDCGYTNCPTQHGGECTPT